MRDLQVRFVHDLVPGQNQIEIERPRRALVRPRPAGLALDRSQRLEDLRGPAASDSPTPDRVQVRRIVLQPVTDRCGFDDR